MSPTKQALHTTRRAFGQALFGPTSRWVLLAAIVGVCGGVAAVAFRWLIEVCTEELFHAPTGVTTEGIRDAGPDWWLFLLIPAAGGLVVGLLVQRLAPEAEGHGTDSVIHAYHRLKGEVRQRVIFIKALASSITIGSGGSAGQEGPVAQVGAGIGSSIARALKLPVRDRRLLLLSGGSAGVGAMFCSPLGGALFMPEVLYKKSDLEADALIPCIISSIFAYATYTTISGDHRAVELSPELLSSLSFSDPRELAIYLILGIACTLVGWAYTKVFYGVHALNQRSGGVPKFLRPMLGGLAVGAIALGLSLFTGESGVLFGGYGLMETAISGGLTIPVLLLLLAAKIVATSATISSGGSGGVFAPALAIGALLGAAVGQGAASLFPGLDINPAAFALVGMGGFFAGVAKVPITSVIMVSEMTGSYSLLAPLMLVAVIHTLLSQRWSMYEAQVPAPVDSPAHAGDFVVDILESLKVSDVIAEAHKPHLIRETTTLRKVLRTVADSKESYFPVVNADERLVGIFSLTDLRRIYLEDEAQDVVIARDFMVDSVVSATMEEDLHTVLTRMTTHHINALPVVDSEGEGRVLCILDRNELGRAYDRRLGEMRRSGDETSPPR
ncbi:MAG: chloride channel protein [Planctomycetes bacterium]|nr:chloride channel protein [Planctomycetota bacterium]